MSLARFTKPIRAIRFLFHDILIVSLICAILLYSLVLAGCTSSSTPILKLYLVSFSYQQSTPINSSSQVNPNLAATFNSLVNGTSLEVRAGYFGLCVTYAGSTWICSSNSIELARQFRPLQDPLNLIWASQKFKDGVVFSGLIIAAIVFVIIAIALIATFPRWHQEESIRTGGVEDDESEDYEVRDIRPFPSGTDLQLSLVATIAASLLFLVSMIWQHTASVAVAATVQDIGYGTIDSKVGALAMALGWVGLGCVVVPAAGILVIVVNMQPFRYL